MIGSIKDSVTLSNGLSMPLLGLGVFRSKEGREVENAVRWALEAGYLSQGDEDYQLAGWGDGDWSLGIARRQADDSEAPDGEALNTRFSQVSGALERIWRTSGLQFEVQALASKGTDIGKSSTDFPDRVTLYPDERHLLIRFAVRDSSKWLLEAWTHPNSLDTEVEEGDVLSAVENEALDFGFNWQRRLRVAGTVYAGDAVAVGATDLTLGLPTLKQLENTYKLPLVSANLQSAAGKALLTGRPLSSGFTA